MAYEVAYEDEAGYKWTASFETQEDALAQAVADTILYGGQTPQEITDSRGVVVKDTAEIEQAAQDAG